MATVSLPDARSAVVRDRVLEAVFVLLERGEDLTFAKLAKAADVPERTVYRYFPTRDALMSAVFMWANDRIGFEGLPVDGDGATRMVRRVFPGFDAIAPVIRELLVAREGLEARLSNIRARRRAATDLVRHEAPGLDRETNRRIAAATQLLTSAAAWQTLRDYWSMDGQEAAETAALAIDLILEAARVRAALPETGTVSSRRKKSS